MSDDENVLRHPPGVTFRTEQPVVLYEMPGDDDAFPPAVLYISPGVLDDVKALEAEARQSATLGDPEE